MSNDTAHGLLARARDDAAAVRAALPLAEITDGIVGFHAQQAVEKSIKRRSSLRATSRSRSRTTSRD